MFRRNLEEPPVIPPGVLYRAHLDVPSEEPDFSKGIPSAFFTIHQGKDSVSFGLYASRELNLKPDSSASLSKLHVLVVCAHSCFKHPVWPNYSDGDAVELFFATKNWKETRIINRYCHRLVVFTESLDGVISREITQFRPIDRRPLLPDNLVTVQSRPFGCGTILDITIPLDSLYGWEADEDLGFACRVFREGSVTVSTPGDFSFETTPAFWMSLHI